MNYREILTRLTVASGRACVVKASPNKQEEGGFRTGPVQARVNVGQQSAGGSYRKGEVVLGGIKREGNAGGDSGTLNVGTVTGNRDG